MADASQTNPTPVTVQPVSNLTPAAQQPLAGNARVSFGPLGALPTRATPITPVRRK